MKNTSFDFLNEMNYFSDYIVRIPEINNNGFSACHIEIKNILKKKEEEMVHVHIYTYYIHIYIGAAKLIFQMFQGEDTNTADTLETLLPEVVAAVRILQLNIFVAEISQSRWILGGDLGTVWSGRQ